MSSTINYLERFNLNEYAIKENNILKSINDNRQYKHLKLLNGFQALIIHDPKEQQSNDDQLNSISKHNQQNSNLDEMMSELHDDDDDKDENDSEEMSEDDDDDEEDDDDDEDESNETAENKNSNEKMAAGVLRVNVGNFSDDEDLPGIAHLLEHVISMGSKKYPKENEFDVYISNHSGSTNALTEYEYTLFEFDIPNEYLHKALDMFANLFIDPLLSATSVGKEVKAVDTEFVEAMVDDATRIEQLFLSLSKPGHPLSKFSWGNKLTLETQPKEMNINVHKRLVDFFNKYYQPENMFLVLQSEESLETMENWVTSMFSLIPKRQSSNSSSLSSKNENSIDEFPFDREKFNKVYLVNPIECEERLEIVWWLPSTIMLNNLNCKPLSMLGSLFGHEGNGSLLAYLRKLNLATELEAGNDESNLNINKYQSLFAMNLQLTNYGKENLNKIIELIYVYINLLKKSIEQFSRYFNEELTVGLNFLKFTDKESSLSYVKKLVKSNLIFNENLDNNLENIIINNYFNYEYNEKLFLNCLDYLTNENANYMIISKNLFNKFSGKEIQSEKWMQAEYKILELNEIINNINFNTDINSLNNSIYFPKENEFLVTDFSMKNDKDTNYEYPIDIYQQHDDNLNNNSNENGLINNQHENKRFQLWFKKDIKFNLPKAIAIFSFATTNETIKNSCQYQMTIGLGLHLIEQKLIERIYPALLAGYNFDIKMKDGKIFVKVAGFNEKLSKLLLIIIEFIREFTFINENVIDDHENGNFSDKNFLSKMFINMKTDSLRHNYNTLISSRDLIDSVRLKLLNERFFDVVEKFNSIGDIENEIVYEAMRLFLNVDNLSIRALIQGNLTENECKEMFSNVYNVFIKNNAKITATINDNQSKTINFNEKWFEKNTSNIIPFGDNYIRLNSFNSHEKYSIIKNYYQIGPIDIHGHCLLELLQASMSEPLFDRLRTQEGLGYEVSCQTHVTYGIGGFSVTVVAQSAKFTVDHVNERIEEFLIYFVEHLTTQMSEETFNDIKQSKIKCKNQPDLYLSEEFERNWQEINHDEYCFDRLKREVTALENIKFDEFKRWVAHYMLKFPSRRKLGLQIIGKEKVHELNTDANLNDEEIFKKKFQFDCLPNSHVNEKEAYINDLYEFRSKLKTFPVHLVRS